MQLSKEIFSRVEKNSEIRLNWTRLNACTMQDSSAGCTSFPNFSSKVEYMSGFQVITGAQRFSRALRTLAFGNLIFPNATQSLLPSWIFCIKANVKHLSQRQLSAAYENGNKGNVVKCFIRRWAATHKTKNSFSPATAAYLTSLRQPSGFLRGASYSAEGHRGNLQSAECYASRLC